MPALGLVQYRTVEMIWMHRISTWLQSSSAVWDNILSSDLPRVQLSTMRVSHTFWRNFGRDETPGGQCGRSGHTAVVDHSGDHMFVFGGYYYGVCINDMFRFHIPTRTWHKMECTGDVPRGVASHAAVLDGKHMLVFGGSGFPFGQNNRNTLHLLNTEDMHWTELECTGTRPSPRYGHSMSFSECRSYAYVYGGTSGHVFFNDCYRFCICTRVWEKLEPTTFRLTQEQRVLNAQRERAMQIPLRMRSREEQTIPQNAQLPWNVNGDGQHTNINAPPATYKHVSVVYRGRLYVLGGGSPDCDLDTPLHVYAMDLDTNDWILVHTTGVEDTGEDGSDWETQSDTDLLSDIFSDTDADDTRYMSALEEELNVHVEASNTDVDTPMNANSHANTDTNMDTNEYVETPARQFTRIHRQTRELREIFQHISLPLGFADEIINQWSVDRIDLAIEYMRSLFMSGGMNTHMVDEQVIQRLADDSNDHTIGRVEDEVIQSSTDGTIGHAVDRMDGDVLQHYNDYVDDDAEILSRVDGDVNSRIYGHDPNRPVSPTATRLFRQRLEAMLASMEHHRPDNRLGTGVNVEMDMDATRDADSWDGSVRVVVEGRETDKSFIFPAARRSHTACVYKSKIYVCGGTDGEYAFSDLWTLDLETVRWSKVKATGLVPRFFHSHVITPNGLTVLYGGRLGLNDTTRVSTISKLWVDIPSLKVLAGLAVQTNSSHI
eukprot:CFRG6561T1